VINHDMLRAMVYAPPETTSATECFPDGTVIQLTNMPHRQSAWVIVRIWNEVVAIRVDGGNCDNFEGFKEEAGKLHANLRGWAKTPSVQRAIQAYPGWAAEKGKPA